MIRYTKKSFKSVLNVKKHIDHWFWTKYSINPYNGCQIGCIYCDSRSNKYHLPLDFENNIIIKENIGPLLEKRIRNARTLLPDVVGIGGTTDAYQPAEKTYKNTRSCLKVLQRCYYPIHIITKSQLVLNDLDLISQIADQNWACVSVTITSTKEKIARFTETRASSPQNRFKLIEKIKSKNTSIQSGVLFIPIIPYLSDDDETLEEMVVNSKKSGADYLLFGGGMTLRDTQALWFLKHLKQEYPHLIPKYEAIYKFKYNGNAYDGQYGPSDQYMLSIHLKLLKLCERYKLSFRIKRFIPNDYRKYNYLVAQQLLDQAYTLQMKNQPWKDWFWTGVAIQNLSRSISTLISQNELEKNITLSNFMRKQLVEILSTYH